MPDADCIGNTITTAATATTHCLRTAIFFTISAGFRKKTTRRWSVANFSPASPPPVFPRSEVPRSTEVFWAADGEIHPRRRDVMMIRLISPSLLHCTENARALVKLDLWH